MAKLPIGTKVFVIETGELGFVLDYFPDFTAAVNINGEIVRVHETGIYRASEFGLKEESAEKEKHEEKKEADFSAVHGLGIVLHAVKNLAGSITRFDVLLVNKLPADVLFLYAYYLDGTLHHKYRKELKSKKHFLLHELKTEQLNDLPALQISVWVKTTETNSEIAIEKEIKLKAKQFFSKLESEEFSKTGFLMYEVMKEIQQKKTDNKNVVSDDSVFEEHNYKKKLAEKEKKKRHIVLQKAATPDVIDLHTEKLGIQIQNLSNTEILEIQLQHCRKFIENAITHKLEKVYVIHGLGKGVLKTSVENLLTEYSEIISYNNNYHPRFGFGATEIILQ